MATDDISHALKRVRAVFERRPQAAMHADEAAVARWEHGLRVVSQHANGTTAVTDMPTEMGGAGACVTPGWLMRAGLAACLTTRIVMEASERGILLESLEVEANSRSDIRGLLAMSDEHGRTVGAAPEEVVLTVRARAKDVSAGRLTAMIQDCHRASPVSATIENRIPVVLRIDP